MLQRGRLILEEGSTCWRVETAARAKLLVDGCAYFSALRAALQKARRSVYLVGWDIHSRVRLDPEAHNGDEAEATSLKVFLERLVRARPELTVHVLLWDYALLYAMDREPLPRLNLAWTTHERIRVHFDDALPLGACHHQKLVVIDDVLAFCGGIDLTDRRWDTPAHRVDDPRRRDVAGHAYGPFHDMMMVVDGEAAMALGEIARRRWRNATGETLSLPEDAVLPGIWPAECDPDLRHVQIGIARTLPEYNGSREVREVEAFYLAAIAAAEREIYIENQYLTSLVIAEALGRRLEGNPDLEVVLVNSGFRGGWLESQTMVAGRMRFIRFLESFGVGDRLRILHPMVRDTPEDGGMAILVHAKVMIVDDRLFTVGSANLNNRSMGFDTECNLVVEAGRQEDRDILRCLRDGLLAEHVGCSADVVRETIREKGSLVRAVDSLEGPCRFLVPVQRRDDLDDAFTETVSRFSDPERPVSAHELVMELYNGVGETVEPATWRRLGFLLGAIVLVIGLWTGTPLGELASPEALKSLFSSIVESSWTPLWVVLIYLLGSIIGIPLTALIVVTAVFFAPLPAFFYGLGGALLGAAVTFGIGQLVGRRVLRDMMGRRLNKISRAVAKRGIPAMMTVRLAPVAPFTVVNLVAGASHIRFRDFMIGSVLGMGPGIAALTAVGESLGRILENPTPGNIAFLVLAAVVWVGLGISLQRFLERWGRRRRQRRARFR